MIALCPNPFRDAGLSKTGECRLLLSEAGYETCVCPVFTGSDWQPPEEMTICSIREVLSQLTHVVVLGGDGTILAVVRELDGTEIPILGVNLGTKGFMTSMEPEELPGIVQALQPGVPVSERMMLEVSLLRSGESILHDYALNDVVIHGYGECILLTPICAHTLSAKPYVLSPKHAVRVLTEKLTGRRAYLAVDGYQVADLESGDLLEIRCADRCVPMIDLCKRSFFEQLAKLS